MTLRKGFAAALQFARKQKGLVQEDFSDVSSRTYLSSLERAMKSPTLDKVEQICNVIGIHPMTLMMLAMMKAERKSLDQLTAQINREINSLNR
jgi:transcriptional regulator with XRE-family HTH domain